MTKADRKAKQARENATRPWYQKKRFLIPLVLLVSIVIGALARGGGSEDEPGEEVELSGYTAIVNSAEFV